MAHPTDVVPGHIEEMLAAYGELQAQFDRVRDRLRRADDQKHTVARRIYDRVRSEYDRELDTIRAKMSPLRDELDRVRAGVEADLRETAAALEAAQEELQEAEFRHRIGEFDGAGFDTARDPLEQRVTSLRARHDELGRALAALDATRTAEPPATTPAPAEAAVAPAATEARPAERPGAGTIEPEPASPAPAPAPARPVLRPSRPVVEPVANFENPQSWIDEIGRDSGRDHRAPQPAAAPSTAVATAPPAPRAGTPSLVFVNGAHAGQAMALLPTTITIGREHDNNIEIKDAEVARYHARVMHERGNWVVEDLDTTTGTWVNGQRTRRASLRHGDVIRVGSTELAIDFDWTAGTV